MKPIFPLGLGGLSCNQTIDDLRKANKERNVMAVEDVHIIESSME